MTACSARPHSCFLIVACVVFVGIMGCCRPDETRTSPFPESNEVDGWTRTGKVRTFPAADLWKYIDGEAERYLKAGVQTASTADYRFRDDFDAVVDVYTMAAYSGAAEILNSEPVASAESARLGDDSRRYSQSLIFRKGAYLVRITAYREMAETSAALLSLGRAVEQRLR